MANGAAVPARSLLLRRGLLLEYLTVGWNILEGAIAVGAGIVAGSPALIGYGVDSFVETISGGALVWRLRAELSGSHDEDAVERIEQRAARFVGSAFLILAAYVALEAVQSLIGQDEPGASPVGIVLTAVAIPAMLLLARAKHATGEALDSRALVADARQTSACWYLSVTALVGLALNGLFALWWADPLAALAICVLLVREGLEAIRGEDDQD